MMIFAVKSFWLQAKFIVVTSLNPSLSGEKTGGINSMSVSLSLSSTNTEFFCPGVPYKGAAAECQFSTSVEAICGLTLSSDTPFVTVSNG